MTSLRGSATSPICDRDKPVPGSLFVHLLGLERFAPPGRHDTEVRSWLHAPLLGAPMLQRLLEPLLGLPVHEVIAGESRGARLLSAVLRSNPRFGIGTSNNIADRGFASDEPLHLHIPADGLLVDGLGAILRSGHGVSPPTDSNSHDERLRAFYVTESEHPKDTTTPFGSLRVLPLCTPNEILETTDLLLAGHLPRMRPNGHWEDRVLRGPRCRMDRRVVLSERVAIGEESLINRDVVLGPGTSIGRRCVIGRGARIEHSVILDDVLVAPGEILSGVVRGPRGDILV